MDAPLEDGIEAMPSGEAGSRRVILRDSIKATAGFERLGAEIGSSLKSLIRMFGPSGFCASGRRAAVMHTA